MADGTSDASMMPGKPRRATAASTCRRGSADRGVRVSSSGRGLSDQFGATVARLRITRDDIGRSASCIIGTSGLGYSPPGSGAATATTPRSASPGSSLRPPPRSSRDAALAERTAVTRAFVVAGTGVDPVTPRFSGVCSAD